MEMQTPATIPNFVRLKILVPRIVGLSFTYQSILGPKELEGDTQNHFLTDSFLEEWLITESEYVFTFWFCP